MVQGYAANAGALRLAGTAAKPLFLFLSLQARSKGGHNL